MVGRALADVLPLSPMQEGLFYQSLIKADGPDVYVVQVVMDVEGTIELDRLQAALATLMRRYPNLRAGFHTASSGPVQYVPAEVKVSCTIIEAATDREAEALLVADRRQRFELARPPLLRCVAVRLPGERGRIALTSHHILMDGWSLPIVLKELFTLYGTCGDDRALPLPPPFRDYLTWLRMRDHGSAMDAWKNALEGLDEATLVQPTRADQGTRALPRRQDIVLSKATTTALMALAREHNFTLNTVVQVLWAQVLSGITGRTDLVFGATVAGRPADLPGMATMVGLLINTLPVRVRLEPAETVLQLLKRIQREQVALLDHQHVSLTDVHRAGGVRELFDTTVVLENYPHNTLTESLTVLPGTGLRVTRVEGHDATHYPLGLVVHPGKQLSLGLYHRPDAIDDKTAAVLADRVRHITAAIATHPDRPMAQFFPTHPDETHRVLHTFNETTTPKLLRRTVHAGFVEHAQLHPEEPAITYQGTTFTYAQVHRYVDRLTRVLRDHGVGAETRVAVLQQRSAASVASVLAILQAGGVYVPLNSNWPEVRRNLVLAHTDAAVVMTDPHNADVFAGTSVSVIVVDELADTTPAGRAEDQPVDIPVDLGQLAYIMYTSGSTGVPKGVMCTHEDVVDMIADRSWATARGTPVAHHVPTVFDPSICEMLVPLTTGGQVVVLPQANLDGSALADLVQWQGVTHCLVSPGLLRLLADDDPACFAGLHELITGGDTVPATTVRKVLDAAPGLTIRAHGGATETTVFATHHPMTSSADVPSTVPMGRPRDNARAYVLDEFLRPVALGVPGEFYLGGDGIARGYVGQPSLTSERFIADPFGPSGARMYRTGDVVRWRPDGSIDFLGRRDNQVKIRGFRVEPGEVEAALGTLPGVAQAAVVAQEGLPGDKQLIGYVVPDDSVQALDGEQLRTVAATILPDYMVPTKVLTLHALPLNTNGKVDRRALPAPGVARASGRAPTTETEQQICALFGEVLGVGEVSVDDDFFQLGGHSLRAMRLIGKARRVLGVELTVEDIFGNPTAAGLARCVAHAPKAKPKLQRARAGGAQ